MILAIPALVGKLDESIIAKALEEISVIDVRHWIEENMGATFHSQRRQALAIEESDDFEINLDLCD